MKKIVNRGFFYSRTKFNNGNNREKIFADAWEKENEPNSHINHGFGLAQDLLIQGAPPTEPRWNYKVLHHLTLKERAIIATMIQWLGSSCGFAFLVECLDKCGYRVIPKDR